MKDLPAVAVFTSELRRRRRDTPGSPRRSVGLPGALAPLDLALLAFIAFVLTVLIR